MSVAANTLRWDGEPGHYEVYYLTFTDPASGCGVWIRYTMVAPLPDTGDEATCSLWLLAMDPRTRETLGRKISYPVAQLRAEQDPFALHVGGSELTDSGMRGGFEDVSWDLSWQPSPRPYEHVHPLLQKAKIAKTILLLPHADVAVSGRVSFPGHALELSGVAGGQAHLWGSKHASSWAWAHCNDFEDEDGNPVADTFIDGVSVMVPRFGREVGPSTPIVGRIAGEDFMVTSPLSVARVPSRFALTSWQFEARDGSRKVLVEVDADRDQLAGVTYHDPDGDLAYCYNSETATMRLELHVRDRSHGSGWRLDRKLLSPGRAHFEYAQRTPIEGLELHTA